LRGPQRHICTIGGRVKIANFTLFFNFKQTILILLDLRSKNSTYPFALKMVPMDIVNCFYDFHHWKFKHTNVDLELFAIFIYKKIAFQQLKGGLCNEFDSSSFESMVFGSTF